MADEGIQYDSSVFPIVHDRYGMPGPIAIPIPSDSASGNSPSFRCRRFASVGEIFHSSEAGTSACSLCGMCAGGCVE